jgi:hypothetical protein
MPPCAYWRELPPRQILGFWVKRMENGQLDPSSLQQMLYDTLDHSDDLVFILRQTGDDAAALRIALADATVVLPAARMRK